MQHQKPQIVELRFIRMFDGNDEGDSRKHVERPPGPEEGCARNDESIKDVLMHLYNQKQAEPARPGRAAVGDSKHSHRVWNFFGDQDHTGRTSLYISKKKNPSDNMVDKEDHFHFYVDRITGWPGFSLKVRGEHSAPGHDNTKFIPLEHTPVYFNNVSMEVWPERPEPGGGAMEQPDPGSPVGAAAAIPSDDGTPPAHAATLKSGESPVKGFWSPSPKRCKKAASKKKIISSERKYSRHKHKKRYSKRKTRMKSKKRKSKKRKSKKRKSSP